MDKHDQETLALVYESISTVWKEVNKEPWIGFFKKLDKEDQDFIKNCNYQADLINQKAINDLEDLKKLYLIRHQLREHLKNMKSDILLKDYLDHILNIW